MGAGHNGEKDVHAAVAKGRLTLDYTPGFSDWRGAKIMQIGMVAKKMGLSVDAARFYERNGLLPRPPRTEGGFALSCRVYPGSEPIGLPPAQMVRRAVSEARQGEKQ